jgi:two-component system, sporulation sensor kinase E
VSLIIHDKGNKLNPDSFTPQICSNLVDLQNKYNVMSSIINSIPDNLIAVDQNWRIIFVNSGARRHLSATGQQELLGKNLWEILPQATEDTLIYQSCQKVMKDRTPLRFEAVSLVKPGWFDFRVYPCLNGIFILFSNIDAIKEAKAKLQESRKLFLTTFNASPYMKSIISLKDFTYIDVNNTWVNKLGYTRQEVVGKHVCQIAVMDLKHGRKLFRTVLRHGRIYNEEGIFYSKNKKDIYQVLISAVKTKLDNEKIIVLSINDITELRKYQAEVQRLDSLNLVGEMASGISHEIRNPITTVRGFLQILRGKEENTKYLDYYNLMIEELDRVNSIITEYLSLTKNKKTERSLANLKDIVENMLPLLESDAVGNDRCLEVDLRQVPDLLLDPKEIRQLLLNLIRNGFEATTDGGVVKVMTYQEGNQVILAVADNGCGIPEEVRDKIGTPFFTTKETGTGLGLSVCYSIVDRHNAQMTFDTGPDGTTFYVRFNLN